MIRVCRLGVVACLALLSLACSTVKPPTASVTGMQLKQVTSAGFTMDFAVRMENPNAVALPLTNVDYGLAVGGARLLSGEAEPKASIPANGSEAVTLPVTVTFAELLKAEEAIRKGGGDIPYALDATFKLGGGTALLGQQVSVPVNYSGTIRLRELLRDPAVLQGPAARELARKVLGNLLPF